MGGADSDAIADVARKARQAGVPLTLPEAATAATPGQAGGIQGRYNSAIATPEGSIVANNFEAGRQPQIQSAMDNIVKSLGANRTAGIDASKAAGEAIDRAKSLVKESAEPYASSAGTMVKGVDTKDPNISEAVDKVLNDPTYKKMMGGLRVNQLGFLDNVREIMDQKLAGMPKGTDTLPNKKTADYQKSRDTLVDLMSQSSPKYATEQDIRASGQSGLVDPLKAGPLGKIAGNRNWDFQGEQLFNARTAQEADDAINAGKRIEAVRPGTVQGLLARRLEDAANRGVPDFLRALPSEHGMRVAEHFGGPAFPGVRDAIDALKALQPPIGQPFTRTPGHSITGTALHKVQQTGEGRVVHMMNDPENALASGRFQSPLFASPATQTGIRGIVGAPVAQSMADILAGRRQRFGDQP